MGLPMVISCPEGEATGIIRDTRSGVCVPPEDPESLAARIRQLHEDPERLEKLARASGDSAILYDRTRQAELMLESLELTTR